MSTLKITTYHPNFNDPRVRKRVIRVLSYLKGMVDHDVVREVMAKDIRKLFGNRSSNPLATWLYANLVTQELFYQVGEYGFPFSYRVRRDGYEKVLNLLIDSQRSQ